MNMDQALEAFIVESRELLADMETALLACSYGSPTPEMINAIFRAAHTIKGSAGLFWLEHIVAFTHVVESVLDEVRDEKLKINDALVTLLLACGDHVGEMIETIASGNMEITLDLKQRGALLIEQLNRFLAPGSDTTTLPAIDTREVESVERIESGYAHADNWHISLRFGLDVLRHGMDPLSFLHYLCTFGDIVSIITLPDAIPAVEAMNPEHCYLGFEIAFKTDADKAAIEGAFEFVRDECQLRILPPHSKISEYIRLINELPEETSRLGEMLVRAGTVTESELTAALAAQSAAEGAMPLGEILIKQGMAQSSVVEAALAKQNQVRDVKNQESNSIRVDAGKLDRLINLVGELIIAGARTNMVAHRAHIAELQECTSALSTLVEEVRDSALQLRMVKIGATFNRFQRVVHDVSREIGKDIRLQVSGEETELDKTVVEKIADPLTHLVRNAIDHGIESVEQRAACGKPAQGTVKLNAYHDSGNIVIEVSDDGGGLKRDRILEKAIERGLVEAGRHLTDEEIYSLIFEPGFSTAEQITNLSGRGVGMDVVKRNITALRGSVGIKSEEGTGTVVTVRLPLTLAIIDGFLVEVGKTVFVIPLAMIDECVEFSVEPGHDYTNLRGQVLPFMRLRELFEIEGAATRRENIVVLKYAGQKAGLVVDTLLGEFQTVIKPLGRMFNQVNCISGSTILGSGDVALILDVPALMQQASQVSAALSTLHDR